MPDPFPFSKMVFLRESLYICSVPDENPNTDAFYLKKNSVIRLNLKSKKFDYIYGFPEIYKKNRYPNTLKYLDMSFISPLNKFVYSFAASENIQVTDIEHRQTKEHYAGSILFDKIKPLAKPIPDEMKNNLEGNKRPLFLRVLYNPYEDLIIRLTDTPSINEDNRLQKQKGSMIFLNHQFNKVGEVVFEEDMFLPNLHFTKEGIYILKQPDKEDEMVYKFFEVVEK
jgi:hypothetical protein